jgi:hypothetical protein
MSRRFVMGAGSALKAECTAAAAAGCAILSWNEANVLFEMGLIDRAA